MKYLQDQIYKFNGKVVWLASYPKSGNTWFRCFLSALFTGEIDIHKIKTDGIFSSRNVFDTVSGIDCRLLTIEEAQNMFPAIYKYHASKSDQLLFVKVHDAFILNQLNEPIFPSEITHKVIYLMRNPLDIVGSFAHHNATTIDNTIALMNNEKGILGTKTVGLNNHAQFPQLMFDWSGHVKSWVDQEHLDVTVIRYEDMLQNTNETFRKATDNLELQVEEEDLQNAIHLSSFKKLQQQEQDKGFKEKNIKAKSFFRAGKTNKFNEELTDHQIQMICDAHSEMMTRFGYNI